MKGRERERERKERGRATDLDLESTRKFTLAGGKKGYVQTCWGSVEVSGVVLGSVEGAEREGFSFVPKNAFFFFFKKRKKTHVN